MGPLGDIYQGLDYIVTKYIGVEYIPNITPCACYRTLFLLNPKFNMQFESTDTTFPLNPPPLHIAWYKSPFYNTLSASQKSNTTKFLTKLASFNITTLPQLQNHLETCILSPTKFYTKYTTNYRIIKVTYYKYSLSSP